MAGDGPERGRVVSRVLRVRLPTLGRELAVLVFFLALSVFATRPLAGCLRTHTLFGPDPAVYIWTVNWLSGHLLTPRELFEGNIFFPTRHVAVLSDLGFGTALLVAPLRPLLTDPVALYNVGVILTLTFGAWAFYRLGLALTGNLGAGLLTGILAAYGSHQLLHVYELALINIGFLALYLLALRRLLERPRSAASPLAAGATFALNALSSGYFAVAGVVLAVVFAAVQPRRFRSREVWVACGIAAGVAALLMLPYIRAFVWLQETEAVERSLDVNINHSFRPSQDLTNAAYVYRNWLGIDGERLFPGIACLLLAAFACLRRAPGWVFYLGAALVLLLLSLGPRIEWGQRALPLPYAAVFAVRPFNAMMHPYSFAAVARFCVCVLAGLGFAAAVGRDTAWARALALALGLTEVAARGVAVRPVPAGVPPIYHALDTLPPGAVLEIPFESPDALIWAARHGRTVVNGTGAMSPAAHWRLEQWTRRDWLRPAREGTLRDVDDTRAMRQLLRMPVAYVIVPAGRDPSLAPLRDAFERSRLFERASAEPQGDVLYRRLSVLPFLN
jgi:hypothetical protein